jgi:hypothetical protein
MTVVGYFNFQRGWMGGRAANADADSVVSRSTFVVRYVKNQKQHDASFAIASHWEHLAGKSAANHSTLRILLVLGGISLRGWRLDLGLALDPKSLLKGTLCDGVQNWVPVTIILTGKLPTHPRVKNKFTRLSKATTSTSLDANHEP